MKNNRLNRSNRLIGSIKLNRSIRLVNKIQELKSNSSNSSRSSNSAKSLNEHLSFRKTEDPNVIEFNPTNSRNSILTVPQLIEYLKLNAPEDLIFNFIGNPLPQSLMKGKSGRPYGLNIQVIRDKTKISKILNLKDIINKKTVYDPYKNPNQLRDGIPFLGASPKMTIGDWSNWGKVYLLEYQNIDDRQPELVFIRYSDPKKLKNFNS